MNAMSHIGRPPHRPFRLVIAAMSPAESYACRSVATSGAAAFGLSSRTPACAQMNQEAPASRSGHLRK